MYLNFFVVHGLQSNVVGWLEVPCELTVTISGSIVNHLPLARHEKTVKRNFISKPNNKEIVGTFLSVANKEGKDAEAKPQQQEQNRTEQHRTKATGEERNAIKGHSRYVAKPKIRKEWPQENY